MRPPLLAGCDFKRVSLGEMSYTTVARLLAALEEADRRAWAASSKLLEPFNKSNRRFLSKGERRRLAHEWEALPAYGRLRWTAEQTAGGGVHLLEERCRARAGSLVIVRRRVRLFPQITTGLWDNRESIARVPALALARWFVLPGRTDDGLFEVLAELTIPPPGR